MLLTMSFALQKLLSFSRSQLLIVSLKVYITVVTFRKWSPVPMCSSVLPTFSSMRFSVVCFMLRSLVHLDLSVVHGDKYGSIFILLFNSFLSCCPFLCQCQTVFSTVPLQ